MLMESLGTQTCVNLMCARAAKPPESHEYSLSRAAELMDGFTHMQSLQLFSDRKGHRFELG